MSKIVASPSVKKTSEFIKIVDEDIADLYELRVDILENLQIEQLKPVSKKLIITIRSKSEGGFKEISDCKKLSFIKKFAEIEPLFVDIEYNSPVRDEVLRKLKDIKIKSILSFHDFNGTSSYDELQNLYANMADFNSDVVKIVTFCNERSDNLKTLKLLIENENLISFCMGEKGKISRIFSLLYSPFTYGYVSKKIAPGQLSVKELKDIREVLNND